MTTTPDPLSLLAIRHGTDKYGDHLYTPEYHRLFGHMRDRELRLLEIGVGGYGQPRCGGQGLRMWAEYFPKARIVGLDVYPKRIALPERVVLREGSQADPAVLDRVWAEDGPFDIVIDDGSHRMADVIATLRNLYPRMPADGIYVVEDAQTAFWEEFGGSPLGEGGIFSFAQTVALAMHRLEMRLDLPESGDLALGRITRAVRFLRNLVVFERGTNTYPSNERLDLEHEEVRRVLAEVDRVLAESPGPGPWLTRMTMEWRARAGARVAETAAKALAAFPRDPDLIAAAGRALSLPPEPPPQSALRAVLDGAGGAARQQGAGGLGDDPARLLLPHGAGAPGPAARADVHDGFWAETGRNAAAAALTAPPTLAVCVCAYRRPDQLPVLMHAMQAQTRRDFVLRITHDGSEGQMLALVRRVAEMLTIPVEWRFSAVRHNDYGHSLRHRAIMECDSTYVLSTNDDNYYVPHFVELMLGAAERDRLDLVLCDMVHSHRDAGGRRGEAYSPFPTWPRGYVSDIGCFIARTTVAQSVGFRDRGFDGDATYINDIMALGPGRVRWGKLNQTLFVHN